MRVRYAIAGLALAVVPLVGHAAVLITPQEAQLPRQAAARTAPGGSGSDRGTPLRPPDVIVVSPKAAVGSPFPLRVTFAPHNGTRIDLTTVVITLLTKPEIDLTDRVKPFISSTGVDFSKAEAPPGQFRLRVDVADSAGGTGTGFVDLQVQ